MELDVNMQAAESNCDFTTDIVLNTLQKSPGEQLWSSSPPSNLQSLLVIHYVLNVSFTSITDEEGS